jgi:RNA 2',3'-cyclic 3'-phosphodiesterase
MTSAGTARLFVALDPPLGVREQLTTWARGALRALGVRAVGPRSARVLDPELLHLTLCFLGDRPLGEVAAIGDALASGASPVGELSIGGPLWLPPRRPRALAVEVHDDPHGGLQALHGNLLGALAQACGFHEEHHRRFRAHITLARLRDDSGRGRRRSEAGAFGERTLAETPALRFKPREIVLYRSWLSPEGASYEALLAHQI